MRFELVIPPASAMRAGKEDYIALPTGTPLHRIHHKAFAGAQFNGTNKGNARFSPIAKTGETIVPTIYAAQSFDCATCEIILRCPDTPRFDPKTGLSTFQIVHPSDYSEHVYSTLVTTVALRLVDLTTAGQRKIGVDQNALLAGPKSTYPATRAWAERIHATCPSAHGLYYNSFQLGPSFAILLFGDRVPKGALDLKLTEAITDDVHHEAIQAIAGELSIDYVDV